MTTTTTTPDTCRVLRCLRPATWRLTVTDQTQSVTTGCYCDEHAGRKAVVLPRPGRRVTLDALALVEAVGR